MIFKISYAHVQSRGEIIGLALMSQGDLRKVLGPLQLLLLLLNANLNEKCNEMSRSQGEGISGLQVIVIPTNSLSQGKQVGHEIQQSIAG